MTAVDELKGGHPPAVKAGGMRIARTNNAAESDAKGSPPKDKDEKAVTDGAPTKSEKHTQQLLISGVNTKGDMDFKEDAVKQYHDKPMPTREKHDRGHNSGGPHGHGKDFHIFQPK